MMRQIQSYVTAVGFPDSFDALESMRSKNAWLGVATDIETLFRFDSLPGQEWVAPPSVMPEDVVFFYHTRRGRSNARRLLREARARRELRHLVGLLQEAAETADHLAGTIFGYGVIGSRPIYMEMDEADHFKGGIFAPLADVRVLSRPIPQADHSLCFALARGGTNTPLAPSAFDCLKARITRSNRADAALLANRRGGDVGFGAVTANNWATVIGREDVRFINETQVRAYFADHLLNELRAPRTPVLEECQCWRNGRPTGIADYFVRVGHTWWPVETKVNALAQRDLAAQVRKYLGAEEIQARAGRHAGDRFDIAPPRGVLIVDQEGCTWIADGRQQHWPRRGLDHRTVAAIQSAMSQASER